MNPFSKYSLSLITVLLCVMPLSAQKSSQKRQNRTEQTVKQKSSRTQKTQTARTKRQPAQAQKAQSRNSRGKAAQPQRPSRRTRNNRKQPAYTNANIRGLQGQRAAIQKKIREQEAALRANQEDVKNRLNNLLVINSEIDAGQKNIEGIQKDIHHIEGNIGILKGQLRTLEQQLQERKQKYINSMHYLTRHHSVQDKLMFIFSAKNFAEMFRRIRFIREYSDYQKAQGELVQAKQLEVNDKHAQLEQVKGHKNNLLYKGRVAQTQLQNKHAEQQKVVEGLQSQQKTIQAIIAEQRKKDAVLNSEIDKLVAQEVAKARARAAAEAARRRAAAQAAARARAAELARKKAAAEAARKAAAERIAAAKAREAQMKAAAEAARKAAEEARQKAVAAATARAEAQRRAAAEAAAKAAAERQARADQAAREAEAAREAAERKAAADRARAAKDIAKTQESVNEASSLSTADRMMSNGFAANKGRLPMPITGGYRIVSHFGQHTVAGLKGVTLDNKGINILGSNGAQARSIYDGEVSAVFGYAGSWVVMVRHGAYISVYANLRNVAVHRGQHVGTRQALGTVGADNILQFQLRRETAKLNPEAWLGR
ncbi:MAG: peptidoglycan DD-metalloendopeptidase family protein [Prevotella sp.]|nr:peptidoglycan DD-metalloendopeptidase family protein [Prevotella sp.]